jgi:hypothetical protein
MRNLLAFLAFVVLGFAGVGWYLDWYKIERSAAPEGHRAYNVEVDTSKIREDVHKGSERVQEALDKNLKEDGAKRADSSKTDSDKPVANQ